MNTCLWTISVHMTSTRVRAQCGYEIRISNTESEPEICPHCGREVKIKEDYNIHTDTSGT